MWINCEKRLGIKNRKEKRGGGGGGGGGGKLLQCDICFIVRSALNKEVSKTKIYP